MDGFNIIDNGLTSEHYLFTHKETLAVIILHIKMLSYIFSQRDH